MPKRKAADSDTEDTGPRKKTASTLKKSKLPDWKASASFFSYLLRVVDSGNDATLIGTV
jgi:hypothetical protein